MHTIAFIHDLAIIMLTAGVVTIVFHLLRQPVVLGYIVAGVLIGPHTPPYALITDEESTRTLGELGVVFLLFSLGLEFSLKRLRQVGATALIAALVGIVTMIWLGYEIGLAFGWRNMDALFLGAMLSISSTTITIKALDELGLRREKFAQTVFGILIIEDVLAICMVALLSSVAKTGNVDAGEVLSTFGKLTVFLVASLVVGILTVPRLLDFIARVGRNEMLLVGVLGLLFGFCLVVIKLGYSVALGAFTIGVIIAEAKSLRRIEHLIEPIRDMFSAVFFVTIGLLLDPRVLIDYAWPITLITLAIVLGKTLARTFGSFAAGQSGRDSMRIGMSLAQIGEFSFIIATLGATLKVTSDFLYPVAVAVSALTTLLTPYLIRWADPLARRLTHAAPGGFRRILHMYTEWLQGLRFDGDRAVIAAMVRRILLQAFVNFCLVAAIFGGGAYLASSRSLDLSAWIANRAIEHTLIWGAALLVSLPFLIAAYRKLKALAMMLAEVSVRGSGRRSQAARRIVAEVLPLATTAAMLLLVCALSSSILPPAELLVAVLVGGALVLALLWRTLVKLHSRLQIALLETIQSEKDTH
ncbi:MAG: cation:proton antiporter [Proteobacteria bacterium]|uniref:cation:proton antiporter n=1 Tax=Rudaea sp. TaxID=2136325 RepID=UPI003784CBD9|nr:cation:proton antiporter [Pseudomonadota bacterium]